MVDISDDNSLDYIFSEKSDESGQSARAIVNAENIARAKLRIETRFKFASKMYPRKYGDKVHQVITGKDDGPVELSNAKATLMRGLVPDAAAEGTDRQD